MNYFFLVFLQSIASSGQSTGSTWSFHPGPSGRLYVKYETTEDVCTKTKGDPLAQKEAVYSTERDKVVQQDQFLVTPLHVLKDMAYQNNKKLIIENITVPDARGPGRSIHRVDIMLEGTRGNTCLLKTQFYDRTFKKNIY